MKKQMLSCVLLAAILLGSVFSCVKDASETEAVAENVGETVLETETEETAIWDDLPSDLTLNGETVSFLYREEVAEEFYAAELNGELVNDAFYNSHLTVEERLDADIEVVLMQGHYGKYQQMFRDHVADCVLANDDLYDWVGLQLYGAPAMMAEGYFMNLLKTPYINLEKPWYVAETLEEVVIDDRLYFVVGDASLGYLRDTICMYYNVQLAEDYNIGDLYSMVYDNTWTIDKLMKFAEIASVDTNGDGKYGLEDKLGFAIHDVNHWWGFIGSLDAPLYARDDDGTWQFSFGNERDSNVCDKLYQFSKSPGVRVTLVGDEGGDDEFEELSNKFMSGDILFLSAEIKEINTKLREMEYPYGVLPYPKLDETQTNYSVISRAQYNAFAMPTTCSNTEAAGAVFEALSCLNYHTVLPAYFETTMKKKYSKDDETSKMFDYIRENFRQPFWNVYNYAIGDAVHCIFQASTQTASSAGTMASTVASKKKMLDTSLATFLEKVSALPD